MWKTTFEERLEEWVALRTHEPDETLDQYLLRINQWWHQTPWSPYYLHWSDKATWPTPWELLDDNIFCTVARGLGILYTLALSAHTGIEDAFLVEAENDNLVLVNSGLYTLNYDPEIVVNIKLPEHFVLGEITLQDIRRKIT